MSSFRLALCFVLLDVAGAAGAQSIPGAVPAKREPHHHLAYEDPTLRVLRVRVPAHDTTLLHEHDPDYFWIALGKSTVINAKLGAPDATITSADLSIHYTPGHFAHVARNPGSGSFDNITVELLKPQGTVRNLCEAALADKPLDCSAKQVSGFTGARDHAAFETNALRVGLLTLAPGAALRSTPAAMRVWLIALDTLDTRSNLSAEGNASWTGGVLRGSGAGWLVRNTGRAPVRVIGIVAR